MPATPPAEEAGRLAALQARLASPMPDDRPWGWLGPLLVTAFGTFLRFDRLRVPRALIFDETYYAKDAWSILNHGVELNLVSNANTIIQAGHTNIFAPCNGTSACGEYVVQPEAGKLLIAAGEWLFGLNSFGWRFASAVFGSLAILLMCRIARRMTRSTLLGCIAGLLMSLDGLEFVLSRTGILDIFLMFFVLAAFGCVLIDRDAARVKLAGEHHRADALVGRDLMHGDAGRRLEAGGAAVAHFRRALHPEFHVLRRDVEFVLQHAARPQRRSLLIFWHADALALEVGRRLDAGLAPHQNAGVEEPPRGEDRQADKARIAARHGDDEG